MLYTYEKTSNSDGVVMWEVAEWEGNPMTSKTVGTFYTEWGAVEFMIYKLKQYLKRKGAG